MWKAVLFGGLAAFLLGGCASYHPLPLTSKAVQARLQPPDMAELRIRAGRIRHPILRPVKLEPRQGLTPDSAAVLAVLLNPSLRAFRDRREMAGAQLLAAGLLPDPELAASFEMPIGGDMTGTVNAYGLELSWNAASLLSRAAKIGGAKASRKAVELDIAWQEWQVAQGAKAAVYRLVSLQNRVALAEQASGHMAKDLVAIRKNVAKGFLTAGVLNTARAASRKADENLLALEKQTAQQRFRLKRFLGMPAAGHLRLSKDIVLPSRVEPPAAPVLIKGLEQRRLDLLALRRGYQSQEAAVRAAIMEQFPRIAVGPTISRDTENVQTAGFGLSIDLPIFNRNQGKIAEERATRQRLFDEYVSRVFAARSDIGRILSGIRFGNERIAAAQATAAELGKVVASYRAALMAGRIDALIYYTAWNDLLHARMEVVRLKGQLAQSVAGLELASGFYEIPKPGPVPPTAPKDAEVKGSS